MLECLKQFSQIPDFKIVKAVTISGPFQVFITVHYNQVILAQFQIQLVDIDINYEKDSIKDKFFYMLQDLDRA